MFYSQLLRARKNIIKSEDLKSELIRLWFGIFIGIFAFLASLALAIFDYYSHRKIVFLIDIITTFFYGIAIILFRFGHIKVPKYIIFFAGYIGITISASILGKNSGLTYLWFPYICGVFILFDIKKITNILILLALILLAIGFLEYTEYSLIYIPTETKIHTKYYAFLCYLISISILSIYIYTLHHANFRYKHRIFNINKNLRSSNHQLIKVNHELDSFVYKASHDLRAPLTSLLGLIEIAKLEKDDNQIEHYLDLCKKTVHKLDSFIVDILNVSKNERQSIQIEKIDFDIIIAESFLQNMHLESANHIKYSINIEGKDEFFSDSRRIIVIFNNLIANAITYSDLTKLNAILNIHIVINNKNARITFIDNGIGIMAEDLEKIFDMFYRASSTGSGSGLGLYIVKETVAKLKGNVQITSNEGCWTHVLIVLPNLSKNKF